MTLTLALVGRANVGKSTLFNRLTKTRSALVAEIPGLTRDRHYGQGKLGNRPYTVVDTGGLEPLSTHPLQAEMSKQTHQAVLEADVVLFLVDGRQGRTSMDETVAEQLRKTGRPIVVLVNKSEGMAATQAAADFFKLGLGAPWPVSALHGDGLVELIDHLLLNAPLVADMPVSDHPCIAILGRPNVGKSTLVNALLGEERMITFNAPGTTRDSIALDFEYQGSTYTVIDTAGVRRRANVSEVAEKFSVLKTLRAVEASNVCLLLLDARQEISDQDAHLAGFVIEAGRALVLAINKWDDVPPAQREHLKNELSRKLNFLPFVKVHYISALKGTGFTPLFKAIKGAYASAVAKLSTPQLTRVLQLAVEKQPPPRAGLQRPKMRYAHQGGSNPPTVVVHGSALEQVPAAYWRYLARFFGEAFQLEGSPLRVQYKTAVNPYIARRSSPSAKPSFRQTLSKKANAMSRLKNRSG